MNDQQKQQPADEQAAENPAGDATATSVSVATALRFDERAIRPGATVRVAQKIVEGNKERVQTFEGVVLARRGSGADKTITVRKMTQGYGVERIFPLSLPTITNIEVVKQARVRRAKLNYLRNPRAKKLKEAA